jgi:integrase
VAWIRPRGKARDGRTRYLIEWRDPAGDRRSKTVVGRDAALALKREIEDALAGGTYVDPKAGGILLRTYADEWLRSAAHLRPQTRRRYEGLLRVHIIPALGSIPVNRLRPSDLRSFVGTLSAKSLAPMTIRHAYALLTGILRTARDDGLIAEIPTPKRERGARGVLPSAPMVEQRYLTPQQIDALAHELGPRYGAMAYLGAYGALRWGEVAGLKVHRLRLLERPPRVDIVETLEGEPKWGSTGSVGIPRPVADILARHLRDFPPGPAGLVFTAPGGGPLRYHNWRRDAWKPAVERAGLEPLRFHDLRHTCAALAIAAGAHPKAVQEHLRHRSITTTLDRYGHLFPALMEGLTDALGAGIGRALEDGEEPSTSG